MHLPLLTLGGLLTAYACHLFLVQIGVYLVRRKLKQENQCLPPPSAPQIDRLFGFDMLLESFRLLKQGRLLRENFKRFEAVGNTHVLRTAGSSVIITNEPENIKAVFATQMKDFDIGWRRRQALAPCTTNTVFVADGAGWHHLRAMVRPVFAKAQVPTYEDMKLHLNNAVAHVPKDGSTINLDNIFSKLTFDVATDFLFGQSSMTLAPLMERKSQRFIDSFHLVMDGSYRRILLGSFMNLSRDHMYYEACHFIHDYTNEAIQKVLDARKLNSSKEFAADMEEQTPGRYVFLNELVKETDDPVELRNQVLSMLIAGSETTAALLVSTFSLLSRDKRVWNKLREEVSQLGGEKPTQENLREFKYLRAVINEG